MKIKTTAGTITLSTVAYERVNHEKPAAKLYASWAFTTKTGETYFTSGILKHAAAKVAEQTGAKVLELCP